MENTKTAAITAEGYSFRCANKEIFEKVEEAIEKQEPKKVEFVDNGDVLLCPCCGFDLMGSINELDHDPPYCFECGQKLDWSDKK